MLTHSQPKPKKQQLISSSQIEKVTEIVTPEDNVEGGIVKIFRVRTKIQEIKIVDSKMERKHREINEK